MTDQTVSIYDLMREVRDHPDFAFGVVFTAGDFPDSIIPEDFEGKYIEDTLAEQGNEYIENEVGEPDSDEVSEPDAPANDEEDQAISDEPAEPTWPWDFS